MKTSLFLFLAHAAVLVAAPACLAAPAPPGSTTGSPSELVALPPVVVTGQRDDYRFEVTFDAKAPIQPIPAQDGADFLKCVPGFSVIRKGGTDGDPMLRGMAGSRLGVLLDGEGILGGCGNRMDPPTAYVFPAAYDRITIVKGPQTVRHGPGNSAGVVLFESDLQRFTVPGASGHAALTAGSFGRFDAALDVRAGVPDYFGRVALTRTRGADYADGAGREVHSRHRRWSANLAAAWTPGAHTELELSAARSDGEAAYADRLMDGVKFDRDNLGLRFRREQLSALVATVEFQAYRNAVDHVMDNYTLRPFVASMMMPGRAVSNPDRLTTGGRAEIALTPAGGTRLTFGADQQQNRHSVRNTTNELSDPYEVKARLRDAEFDQLGVFGEGQRDFDAHRRLVVGGRLDWWKAADHRSGVATSMMNTTPNPSAGRIRRTDLASGFGRYEHGFANYPMTLYAGLGHTSRFPDYWELIKNESATSVSAFGTRPEKTTQLDAGLGYVRGPLTASLSAFASVITDFNLVQSNFAKPSGMMGTRPAVITRNIEASTVGGEAALGWRLDDHWRLDASFACVRGTNETDHRPLAQLPPLESRISLAYTQPQWSLGGLVRAVAAQNRVAVNQGNIVGQDIGASPGFAVVSLNGSWRLRARARLSAGVDNLFATTYAEHVSRAGSMLAGYVQTTRVNEPGRVFWLKLDLVR